MKSQMKPGESELRGRLFVGALLSVVALVLSSCSLLPQAEVDPTRFFVLSTPAGSTAQGLPVS